MEGPSPERDSNTLDRESEWSDRRKTWGEVPCLGDPKQAVGLSRLPGDLQEHIGLCMAAAGTTIWSILYLFFKAQIKSDLLAPLVPIGLCLVVIGIPLSIYGKRLRASVLNRKFARLNESRPPVLYLRPFSSDRKTSRIFGRLFWRLLLSWHPSASFGYLNEMETEEESLSHVVNEIGPMIAIGRPNEILPRVGAARVYVSREEWQVEVTRLISQAHLVLLHLGETPGFWWEFQQCAACTDRQKLVLLVPFNRWQYNRFREKAEQLLHCILPYYDGIGLRGVYGSRVKAVIYFDSRGIARLRPVARSTSKKFPDTRLAGAFRAALAPVAQRFGLTWG
jgi:hypothetical protein